MREEVIDMRQIESVLKLSQTVLLKHKHLLLSSFEDHDDAHESFKLPYATH